MGVLTPFPAPREGPVLVLEPVPQWARAARAAGWRVQRSLPPVHPWSRPGVLVVTGRDCPADAVVMMLARGAGVVLAPPAEGGATGGGAGSADRAGRWDDVLADAVRIGAGVWPGPPPDPVPYGLDDDTGRLLDGLARGWRVGAAARAANMSLRTAHRRLHQARDALGATTTAEAVGRWAQRGHGTPAEGGVPRGDTTTAGRAR